MWVWSVDQKSKKVLLHLHLNSHAYRCVCLCVCEHGCEPMGTIQRLEMWGELKDRQTRPLARSNTLYIMLLTAHQKPPTSSKKLVNIAWSSSLDGGELSPQGKTSSPDFWDKNTNESVMGWVPALGRDGQRWECEHTMNWSRTLALSILTSSQLTVNFIVHSPLLERPFLSRTNSLSTVKSFTFQSLKEIFGEQVASCFEKEIAPFNLTNEELSENKAEHSKHITQQSYPEGF